MSPAQQEQNEHYLTLELNRKRKLQSAYVDSGVPESIQHQLWLQGHQAASGVNTDSRGSSAAQKSPPSPNSAPSTSAEMADEEEDPTQRRIRMWSESKVRWFPLIVNLDSGTPDNWVSVNVTNLLGLPVESIIPASYATFNGQTLKSTEGVKEVVWCGEMGARTRVADFRLARNAPFDVLFGSKLLFSENIYSLNKNNLILAKKANTEG